MCISKKIIETVVELANKSTYYQKIGAVIFKRNTIISKGYNQVETVRKHLHPKFQQWPGSIHAEVDAIIKAKQNLKGCEILIIRVNNDNQFRLAKPCEYCQMYLEYVKIKKIYYSINSFPYIKKLI